MSSPAAQATLAKIRFYAQRGQYVLAHIKNAFHILEVQACISCSERHGISAIRPGGKIHDEYLLELYDTSVMTCVCRRGASLTPRVLLRTSLSRSLLSCNGLVSRRTSESCDRKRVKTVIKSRTRVIASVRVIRTPGFHLMVARHEVVRSNYARHVPW